VLSTVEFDVLWRGERLGPRHVALTVSDTEGADDALVEATWQSLEGRGLARGRRAVPELADRLAVLANPHVCVDTWMWSDRESRALAAAAGEDAMLAVVDRESVWLVETRATALAEAAVSVTGEVPAGQGMPVGLPNAVLRAADAASGGAPGRLAGELTDRGISPGEADALAVMCEGMTARGQFGAASAQAGAAPKRAGRVVAFHDTPNGRYLHLVRPAASGELWSTVSPADNYRLAGCVWELLDEV
jgi:hypothetical protein